MSRKYTNCEIEEADVEDDEGGIRPGTRATCEDCDAGPCVEESFGTSEKSITRCLVLLRENCEDNDDGKRYFVEA
jgi:hypothetical protein